MSTVTAAPEADAAPAKGRKKKLFILIGIAVMVLGLAVGGAVVYLKHKAAAEATAEDEEAAGESASQAPATPRRDPKSPPTFVPLDPFTVNLADREAERYAQVGIALELVDPKVAEQIKLFMPVIRNNILMVLAHKTSAELLERDGKARLAHEVQLETARALGVEIPAESSAAGGAGDAAAKNTRRAPESELPVVAVHFSNFIIQ